MRPYAVPMLLLLALATESAHAKEPAAPPATGAAREFVVEGQGGAFEVVVSPTYVTTFYLPEEVTQALASDQKNFSITIRKNTVALRPVTNKKGLTANLNIDTANLHLSVILKIGSDQEAVSLVIFTRAEDKIEFEKRVADEVEKRVAPMRAEYERKQQAFEAEVTARATQEISSRMLQQLKEHDLDAIARTDDNVIVRVTRVVHLGDDVYLHFTIQNRGDAAYRVKSVAALKGRDEIAGRVTFEPRAVGQTPVLGVAEGGRLARGIIALPLRAVPAGSEISLQFTDMQGRALVVGAIRL